MRAITTRRELIAPWLRMRRSLAQFSGSDELSRMPWSAGCIINTSESKFSVHTGLEVDQEFKFGGLHDREVPRPLALENATCVDATLAKCVTRVGTIRHQAAGQRKLALNSHGREMIASSECVDLIQSAEQKRIGGNCEHADFLLDESRKGGLQVAIGGGSEHKDGLVESARCGLHVIRLALGIGVIRVQKDRDHTRLWDHSAQQLQPLMFERNLQEVNAGDVAAGPVVTGNKTKLDRIATVHEDDWNSRGRCLSGHSRDDAAGRKDYGNATSNQLVCSLWQPIEVAIHPPVVDRDVAALNKARFIEAGPEADHAGRIACWRSTAEEPNHRHRRLLPPRALHLDREQQAAAPDQGNELTPLRVEHGRTTSPYAPSV